MKKALVEWAPTWISSVRFNLLLVIVYENYEHFPNSHFTYVISYKLGDFLHIRRGSSQMPWQDDHG